MNDETQSPIAQPENNEPQAEQVTPPDHKKTGGFLSKLFHRGANNTNEAVVGVHKQVMNLGEARSAAAEYKQLGDQPRVRIVETPPETPAEPVATEASSAPETPVAAAPEVQPATGQTPVRGAYEPPEENTPPPAA